MADNNLTANRWLYGSAYLALMVALMLFYLLPTQLGPRGLPGPDLLLCVTILWLLRRPHYVPTLLVAAVFLLADMLFLRPPGLWAALVVLAVEFLRARETSSREQPFLVEWAIVAGVMLAITLAYRLILALFLIDQGGLNLALMQLFVTILAYPVVVLVSRFLFGVARMTPGETDARGRPR
ncbi:MAG: rod shape-determining protein MreD [Rhodobacter sp.]|nr:rod shape-determining protein MreD [Rhodobacter sp.]